MPELKCINSFLRNSTELNRMPLCSDFNISEVFTWCLVPLTQNCKIGGGLDPPYSFSRDFLEWSFSCSKLDTKISEQIKFSGENGNYSLSTTQTYRCSSRLLIQTEKQLAQKWSFVLRFFRSLCLLPWTERFITVFWFRTKLLTNIKFVTFLSGIMPLF